MIRYKINLTALQWAVIAMDLGKIDRPEESTQVLQSLIKVALDHAEDPPLYDLPFNIEVLDDQG